MNQLLEEAKRHLLASNKKNKAVSAIGFLNVCNMSFISTNEKIHIQLTAGICSLDWWPATEKMHIIFFRGKYKVWEEILGNENIVNKILELKNDKS